MGAFEPSDARIVSGRILTLPRLTALAAAGCTYIMGVPGADDIMLNYQSSSFHDALYLRELTGLRPAPEFEQWLIEMGIFGRDGKRVPLPDRHPLLELPEKVG